MSNPVKPTLKSEIFPMLLILVTMIASIYFYFNLPDRIPVHWNFAGGVDRYGSGKTQSILFPIMIIGMYLLFLFLPYIDPKKERYEQFTKTYNIFRYIILFVLVLIYFAASLSGLGYNLRIDLLVPALIGLMFIAMGNYMGKIKSNWFVGIRTPWTLSSEEVWNKTHRFGGKVFMLAGALIFLEGFLPFSWRLPIFILAMVTVLIGTIGSSYIFYLSEKKKNKNDDNIKNNK